MGIEPTSSAWKAEVLPLNYTRMPAPAAGRGTAVGRQTAARRCDWFWWREEDSNPRRLCQQIYSLPPLTAWVSLRNNAKRCLIGPPMSSSRQPAAPLRAFGVGHNAERTGEHRQCRRRWRNDARGGQRDGGAIGEHRQHQVLPNAPPSCTGWYEGHDGGDVVVSHMAAARETAHRDGRCECGRRDGAGERIRTPDRLITNQLLYRLSYASAVIRP